MKTEKEAVEIPKVPQGSIMLYHLPSSFRIVKMAEISVWKRKGWSEKPPKGWKDPDVALKEAQAEATKKEEKENGIAKARAQARVKEPSKESGKIPKKEEKKNAEK